MRRTADAGMRGADDGDAGVRGGLPGRLPRCRSIGRPSETGDRGDVEPRTFHPAFIMFRVFLAATAIGGTLATAAATATATASTVAFTSESAVERALRHNPDLLAARLAIAEAEGRLRQAGRRANPEVEAAVMPNIEGREFSLGVGLKQAFPLTDRLRLEKSVSEAGVDVALAEVRAAERRLVREVRSLVVRWLALKGRRALVDAQIVNSVELAGTAAKAAASGEGSPLEAAQFELEAEQLSLDVARIESERTSLVSAFRPLLGLPAEATVEVTGELNGPGWTAEGPPEVSGPEAPPEMMVARARVEAARRHLALEQKNRWQDAAVGLTAEVDRSEDAPDGLQTDGFVGLTFSLPLPFWNKNEGRLMEAEAVARRREAEAEAVAAGIRAEAAAARAEMVAAARVHEQASGALLGKARQLEDRYWTAYRAGQASLTDVIRSREKRLALEASALEALRDYHLARVRLAAATGR